MATGDRATRASAPFEYLGVVEGLPAAASLDNGLRITFLGVDTQEDGSMVWHYAVEVMPGAQDAGAGSNAEEFAVTLLGPVTPGSVLVAAQANGFLGDFLEVGERLRHRVGASTARG